MTPDKGIPQKGELLYEGKAKKIYATSDPGLFWVEYKDEATAFNGAKKSVIAGKGSLNNRISAALFSFLTRQGVPNHFVSLLSDREQLVRKVTILPLEVVVRNVVAGSLARRLGLEEGKRLAKPVVEFYYKDDALGDPLVTEDHIALLELATAEELKRIRELALEVNRLLTSFFDQRDVILVDFKLEFGRTEKGEWLVADEISPDTCRLWDKNTLKKLDKDRFRQDLGGLEEAYEDILHRVGNENHV